MNNKKEDLGIKIGTPIEVFWENIKRNCKANILNMEQGLLIERQTLKLAEDKLKE